MGLPLSFYLKLCVEIMEKRRRPRSVLARGKLYTRTREKVKHKAPDQRSFLEILKCEEVVETKNLKKSS